MRPAGGPGGEGIPLLKPYVMMAPKSRRFAEPLPAPARGPGRNSWRQNSRCPKRIAND